MVRVDADSIPDGEDERVVEYEPDAMHDGGPVHFGGKFVFAARDLVSTF